MHHFDIVAKTDFKDGYVAVVLHDTPIVLSEIHPRFSNAYGVEFCQGSVWESEAGLIAREAFQAYGRYLHKLHEQAIDL